MSAAVGPQVPRVDFPKLFNRLVCAHKNRWGYGKTEHLGGLEIHGHYPSPPEQNSVPFSVRPFAKRRIKCDALFRLLAYNLLRSRHLDRQAMHRRSS